MSIARQELVDTKPYGDAPYFCTLDYTSKPKNEGDFWPGFCVDHSEQHLESFWSLMRSVGVYDKRIKYSEGKEKHDWLILIKNK